MQTATCTLDDVAHVTGTVVVVDVLRAFTTAAVALAAGPAAYELVGTVEEAFARREADPDVRLVGEVDGRRPEGFDHSNSPVEMAEADVGGRRLVHRSSAGTQGVVRATRATEVLVASFAVAGATASALADRPAVTFCITGRSFGRDGDEDQACADYIAALLQDRGGVDPAPYLARIPTSSAGRMFTDPSLPWLPPDDMTFAAQADRYGFAMPVVTEGRRLVLTRTLS